jgi:hypothetical protein
VEGRGRQRKGVQECAYVWRGLPASPFPQRPKAKGACPACVPFAQAGHSHTSTNAVCISSAPLPSIRFPPSSPPPSHMHSRHSRHSHISSSRVRQVTEAICSRLTCAGLSPANVRERSDGSGDSELKVRGQNCQSCSVCCGVCWGGGGGGWQPGADGGQGPGKIGSERREDHPPHSVLLVRNRVYVSPHRRDKCI